MPGFRSSRTRRLGRSRSGRTRSPGRCGCRYGGASGGAFGRWRKVGSWRCALGHELDEAVEEVGRVVRTGGGLGVVLNREGRDVKAFQPLHHVVVEADVRDTHLPVSRVDIALQGGVHGEAMVVRSDLDRARAPVQNRLVDAAMAVLELVGAESERATEDLVAEADSEERHARVKNLAQQGDLAVRYRRVTGAVGEEDAVGPGDPAVAD